MIRGARSVLQTFFGRVIFSCTTSGLFNRASTSSIHKNKAVNYRFISFKTAPKCSFNFYKLHSVPSKQLENFVKEYGE
jgi:hypothetical protein